MALRWLKVIFVWLILLGKLKCHLVNEDEDVTSNFANGSRADKVSKASGCVIRSECA